MRVRFHIDQETSEPHLHRHGVATAEAEEVLTRPLEDRLGAGGVRVAMGQTQAGRYLRVIYVVEPESDTLFVITAYELGPKAKRALKRRCGKKR